MHVVDSHTGGEPTRVILEGGPDLGTGPLAERARRLAEEHMGFCHAVMREPRGQPAMVGALLVQPTDPTCAAVSSILTPMRCWACAAMAPSGWR